MPPSIGCPNLFRKNHHPVVSDVSSLHKSGVQDCEHRAFRAYVTPNVTEVSALSGNDGVPRMWEVNWQPGSTGAGPGRPNATR